MKHSKKLEEALHGNRASGIKATWPARLSTACRLPITGEMFLGVEQTAAPKKRYIQNLIEHRNDACFWPRIAVDAVTGHLTNLAATVPDLKCLLFSSVDECIGAVCLPAAAVLANAADIWAVVEDDLRITTDNTDSGLCLGAEFYVRDEHVKAGVLQLTCWGLFGRLYQLVIEFQCSSVDDYDRIVETESLLERDLQGWADIDGHDAGGGVMNIFILTRDPCKAFELAAATIEARNLPRIAKAGYRFTDQNEYRPLWPPTATSFEPD